MAVHRQEPLALAAARRGAVEHRQMLGVEARRAFERHRSAGIFVGGVDLPLGEADLGQEVEIWLVDALSRQPERPVRKASPSVHLLKANLMSKAVATAFSAAAIFSGGEALRCQRLVIDAWSAGERAAADGIIDDALDRCLVVAERGERLPAPCG